MRRPGILSEVDTITPETAEKYIAEETGLAPPAKMLGLPATILGIQTKWIIGVGLLVGLLVATGSIKL